MLECWLSVQHMPPRQWQQRHRKPQLLSLPSAASALRVFDKMTPGLFLEVEVQEHCSRELFIQSIASIYFHVALFFALLRYGT